MLNELFTIVVSEKLQHPQWISGSFVALKETSWGPSPVLDTVSRPVMFASKLDAQEVIDKFGQPGFFEVATFKRKR